MTILPIPARRPARKRGVTLIEAVLFISIALGLIVGGIVFFQQASLAQRVNDAVRTISGIASETRALYQSSTDFTGLDVDVLIAAGAVPTSIINADNDGLVSEWGTEIDVVVNADDANFFDVTYPGVPTAACVRLVTFDNQGSGVIGSGIAGVTIGDAAEDDNGLTPAEAADDDNGCAQDDEVDIVWRFSR